MSRPARVRAPLGLPWTTVAIVVITLVGLVLRLLHFGESLAEDEFLSYGEVHGRGFLDVLEQVRGGVEQHPPLFFVLAWASEKVTSAGEMVRLPSLVGGVAVIPVIYLLGARTAGRTAGLVGAAFIALSPFAIFQSVEARPYGLLAFFAGLSTLCLLVALERRRWPWWVLYVVASAGLLYTHNFGIFILVAQAAWALWVHREQTRGLILVHVAIALVYLPWVPAFLNRGVEAPAFLKFFKPLTIAGFRRELLSFFPGHPQFLWSELPGRGPVIVLLVVLAAAAVLVAVRLLQDGVPRPSRELVLIVLLALATPVGFLAYSLSGPETMTARYLTASMPALMILLGALLAALPRPAAIAAVGAVVAVLCVGVVRGFGDDFTRPDYEAAAHYVEDNSTPDDGVVFADLTLGATGDVVLFGGRALSLEVYLDNRDIYPVFAAGDAERAFSRASSKRRIFVVSPYPQPKPPREMGARATARREFPGSLPLAVTTYVPTGPSFEKPRAPSTPAGGDAGAAPVLACLDRAGLTGALAQGSPAGSTAIDVSGLGGRSTLYLYASPGRAETAAGEIRAFVQAGAGGDAKAIDRTVLGYLDAPPAAALAATEDCAGEDVTGPSPAG
jgi:4-amino-4-deoxy-L-arabinose transferase-like glycosyltransferase